MEAQWPGGGEVLILSDAAHRAEARLVREWVGRAKPAGADADIAFLPSARRRRPSGKKLRRLSARLKQGGDPLLAPVRVVWEPPARSGTRGLGWRDFLTLRDPRYPGNIAGRLARRRARIALGEPAPLSELRREWSSLGKQEPLTRFVARRALLALERAEREIRGARYKVPRLVKQDILADAAFRKGLAEAARRAGLSDDQARQRARRYLKEIAAAHNPFVIDLTAAAIRLLCRRGYEAINYRPEELKEVARLAARGPVVFLPSHRSNMDRLSLQYLLWENDHPPNHTAGGVNMNFFPVGPVIRRAGVFFIRRSFRDNPVYKHALRSYLHFLLEKRFTLEWYIEGGRSRTGKMLAPRYGLLGYAAEAVADGKAEDVLLMPTAIGYDQIFEAGAYAAEQRGRAKQKENLAWTLASVRRLRRRHGAIHLRFGEPLSLRRALGNPVPAAGAARHLAVQKAAFEVCVRINRAMPVTPAALAAGTLLAAGPDGLTGEELDAALDELAEDAAARRLPVTERLDGRGRKRALEILAEHGLAETARRPADGRPVHRIAPGGHLAAAYYRNGVVHFYLARAAAELGLAAAAEGPDPAAVFRQQVAELRDFLKFDFFFPSREAFQRETEEELAARDGNWEERLRAGGAGSLLEELSPRRAPWALRSFLEAYLITARELADRDPGQPWDEKEFLAAALRRGEAALGEGAVADPAALSHRLFGTALQLAAHRRLLEPSKESGRLAARRREWQAEAERLNGLLNRLSAGRWNNMREK